MSSARVVRCWVKSRNERNPYLWLLRKSTLKGLPLTKRRKVGMTSNHHAPYDLGYTRTTMAINKEKQDSDVEQISKNCPSSDCRLQLAYMKSELLVIADQNATVNTFPGLVHTPVTPWESVTPEVGSLTAMRTPPKVGLMTGVKS